MTQSEDRRQDITLAALRHNWVILVAAFFAVVAYANGENRLSALEDEIKTKTAEYDELLDRDAFKTFAIWQTNVDRDIKELRKSCLTE